MKSRSRVFGCAVVVLLLAGADAFACGDKFLVSGRGTRYQRPKSARAASVLIYANPASGLPSKVGKLALESVLKREGHRSTTVETIDQLAALVSAGRFDVVIAATSALDAVTRHLGGAPDAPAVVAFCTRSHGEDGAAKRSACLKVPAKEGSLLQAIDKAVEQRDRALRLTRNIG